MNRYILVLVFVLSLSALVQAYELNNYSSEITVYQEGYCRGIDSFTVSDVNVNSIVFPLQNVTDVSVSIGNEIYPYFEFDGNSLVIDFEPIAGRSTSYDVSVDYVTDSYLSKNSIVWTLDYKPLFSSRADSVKFVLPKNAEITSVVQGIAIGIVNGSFVLSVDDVDEFSVGYRVNLNGIVTEKPKNSYLLFIVAGVVIILVGFVSSYLLSRRVIKKKIAIRDGKEKTEEVSGVDRKEDLLLGLNENEQKIIKVLMSEGEGISQKLLAVKAFLPKGTVSRNIKKLISKGYIDIKRYGVTHKLFLGDVFRKGQPKNQ